MIAEELDRMVVDSDAAALSLADAPVDAIGYACLVAVLARGPGARDVEERLERALLDAARQPPLVTSEHFWSLVLGQLRDRGREWRAQSDRGR